MNNSTRRSPLLAVALALVAASSAQAQETAAAPPPAPPPASPPPAVSASGARPVITGPALSGISVLGELVWDGFGFGGRYMFPIGIPSLLSHTRLKDSWALEAGIDWVHRGEDLGPVGYHYDQIIPTFGMMWTVWLTDQFAVYPKIDAGYEIGFNNSLSSCYGCSVGGVWVEGAAGLLYRISSLTLRAELGDYGIKGGVAWLF
jgi:hypothetical protein